MITSLIILRDSIKEQWIRKNSSYFGIGSAPVSNEFVIKNTCCGFSRTGMPAPKSQLIHFSYLACFITGSEATAQLKNEIPGTFIVRFSERLSGEFVISYAHASGVRHYLVQPGDISDKKRTFVDFLGQSSHFVYILQVHHSAYHHLPKRFVNNLVERQFGLDTTKIRYSNDITKKNQNNQKPKPQRAHLMTLSCHLKASRSIHKQYFFRCWCSYGCVKNTQKARCTPCRHGFTCGLYLARLYKPEDTESFPALATNLRTDCSHCIHHRYKRRCSKP